MRATPTATPLRILGTALRGLATWAPVWLPLGMFAQIALLGLKPARLERERLEAAAPAVEARHARIRGEWERMSTERAAWDDEVYRERWRRSKELEREDADRKP